MTDRTDHSDLPSRIEGEEVGSRELDALLWFALLYPKRKLLDVWPSWSDGPLSAAAYTLPPKRTRMVTPTSELIHPVTTSLDAALALVERVLPEWRASVYCRAPGSWEAALGRAYLGRADQGPHEVRLGSAKTAPLALCAALLKALPKNEKNDG